MSEETQQPESPAQPLGSDDLLSALAQVSNAAASMAERLKMLMESHARQCQSETLAKLIGERGIKGWGREAHWWMEQLGEYFNGTDSVDEDDPRDQSWSVALDVAREFFPLDNVESIHPESKP